MSQKQSKKAYSLTKLGIAAIVITTALTVLFGLSLTTALLKDDPSSPAHPLYGSYVSLMYNNKCVVAGPRMVGPRGGVREEHMLSKENIIKWLYSLNIPKEEARRIFEENRDDLKKRLENNEEILGAWKDCPRQSLIYFNRALEALDEL